MDPVPESVAWRLLWARLASITIRMTFAEAVTRIMQDRSLLAVLPPRLVLTMSNTGKLMHAQTPKEYARLGVHDVLAVNWETHYPWELMQPQPEEPRQE